MRLRTRARNSAQLDLFDREPTWIAAPARADESPLPPPRRLRCCGTPRQRAFLRQLYTRLNHTRFGGRLPQDLPLRLSARMSFRYGHVTFLRSGEGKRSVVELALNVQLLAEGNEDLLLDTLLHEMAHVEAWLRRGHRRHGRTWKQICVRVGCVPRACTHVRIEQLPGPVLRVPPLPLVLRATAN